jgi:hypothetical protein
MNQILLILDKTKELINKLQTEGQTLDELQKAQVIQTLIIAKAKLQELVAMSPDHADLKSEIDNLSNVIDAQAQNLDLEKVQTALTFLSEGVEELLKRKDSGQTVIKE